jgi:uncharacterized Fe-S cluster-containing radical SAM superfamily protein
MKESLKISIFGILVVFNMRSKREKEVFNRLMESLKYGQTQPILVSSLDDSLIVDGYKRKMVSDAIGLELEKKTIKHQSREEWLRDLKRHASCPETKESVRAKYEAIKKVFPELGTESIIQILMEITGKSRMTLYRWLGLVSVDTYSNKHKEEKMYKDVETWNPHYGCNFNCIYCKPSFQAKAYWQHKNCGLYTPHIHRERLDKIPNAKVIFVCGDSDIYWCPFEYGKEIVETMNKNNRTDRIWLLQSKKPSCFKQYLDILPKNTYIGTTLETNKDEGYEKISNAPKPSERYREFKDLEWDKKYITIEPIMSFDKEEFVNWIVDINPDFVFIGYNSHPNEVCLPEPSMDETIELIHELRVRKIDIVYKLFRQTSLLDLPKLKEKWV